MNAIVRIALDGQIDNIRASWVKFGPQGIAVCLNAGVNDLGGTLMNESVTRAAGAQNGQEAAPQTIEGWIEASGRHSRVHTTVYGNAGQERRQAAHSAGELSPVVLEHFKGVRKQVDPSKRLGGDAAPNQPRS